MMLADGTNKIGRLSWIVGAMITAIYRIIQGCYGDDIVLLILEPKLELEVKVPQ